MSISDIMELSCIALRQIAQRMKSEITSNKKVISTIYAVFHCLLVGLITRWLVLRYLIDFLFSL